MRTYVEIVLLSTLYISMCCLYESNLMRSYLHMYSFEYSKTMFSNTSLSLVTRAVSGLYCIWWFLKIANLPNHPILQ